LFMASVVGLWLAAAYVGTHGPRPKPVHAQL
jgi:hypothetical protein